MKQKDSVDFKHAMFEFDEMFRLSLPRHYFRTFQTLANIPKKKNAMTLENMENAFIEKLKELISTLLRQERIFGVVLNKHTNINEQQDDLRSHFFLGLTLGEKWANAIMRGPPANTEEGKKFREEFGEMSDIRKFVDNALCESVCWVETDENNFPSDSLELSMIERYLNFICYKKLQVPLGSLTKLFELPKKWVSIIPRSLLSPSFLQNAYYDLANYLRKINVLSLGIVGVNCVSSYYRDTEPFRLGPAPELWRRSKDGNVYQRLNEDNKIPAFVPSIKVFITLEQTGKWGKNLKVIQSYKTACYIELASEFSNTHRVNAVAKDDCVLILLNGVVFKVMIIHDNELRDYQKVSGEFCTDLERLNETSRVYEATISQQLLSVSQRFTAFGETCQVVKRWLGALNFSAHLNEMAIELLVAKCFLEPSGRSIDSITPMSVSAGFLQFLRLMATHNFLEEPIFVDINENFNDQEKEDIGKQFLKCRPALPCMCISMPEDRAGIRYTTTCPEPIVMCRLVKIARQTLKCIKSSLEKLSAISYRQICVENTSIYDLGLSLDVDKSTRFVQHSEFIRSVKQSSVQTIGGQRAIAMPVVDFDLSKRLIDEYSSKLGKYAIFFYDKYRANRIFVLYRKNFRSPSKKHIAKYAEDLQCSEDSAQLSDAFKKKLLQLGTGIVKSIGGSS